MHWTALRYYGLRHTLVGAGLFTAAVYAASTLAGVEFGLVALGMVVFSTMVAVYTALGTGGIRNGYTMEYETGVVTDDPEEALARNHSGAVTVFFFALGVTVWMFGTMVAFGI